MAKLILALIVVVVGTSAMASEETQLMVNSLQIVDQVCDHVAAQAENNAAGYSCYRQGLREVMSGESIELVLLRACSYVALAGFDKRLGYQCLKYAIGAFGRDVEAAAEKKCNSKSRTHPKLEASYYCFFSEFELMVSNSER